MCPQAKCSKMWPHTVREENKLTVFENRVSGRIFSCNMKEVAGGWRKLQSE
jgi:hypothetical protein